MQTTRPTLGHLPFLALPALVLSLVYLLASTSFPRAPSPTGIRVHRGLSGLPNDSRALRLYPADFYDGGAWLESPYGRIRYWLLGPEKGRKVVLIHGLSVPAIIWKDVAPRLASSGYRVLLYDLYGRGHTDAPDVPYTAALYTTQLAILMQHLGWQKASIAGVSMGGALVAAFAAHFPSLVDDKVALVCPVGLMQASDFSRTSRFMSSPGVQTVLGSWPVRQYLNSLSSTPNVVTTEDKVADLVRIMSASLRGYNGAIASSLRAGPVRGQEDSFRALGESGRDVLFIWGTADESVPYSYSEVALGLVPQGKLVTVQDAPHDVTLSHPVEVADALVAFLAK